MFFTRAIKHLIISTRGTIFVKELRSFMLISCLILFGMIIRFSILLLKTGVKRRTSRVYTLVYINQGT